MGTENTTTTLEAINNETVDLVKFSFKSYKAMNCTKSCDMWTAVQVKVQKI